MNPAAFGNIDHLLDKIPPTSIPVSPMPMMMLEKTLEESASATTSMRSEYKELSQAEYSYRRRQLCEHFPSVIVDHDWMAALKSMLKVESITDDLIQLPFEETTFYLNYRQEPLAVVIGQDQNTHRLTVYMVDWINRQVRKEQDEALTRLSGEFSKAFGETEARMPLKHVYGTRHDFRSKFLSSEELEEIKDEIRFICMAMEIGVVSKEAMSRTTTGVGKPTEPKGNEYYVLTLRKRTCGVGKVRGQGSRQRLHVKRSHWRTINGVKKRIKWFLAGDINLGIIVKDYKIDDESLA